MSLLANDLRRSGLLWTSLRKSPLLRSFAALTSIALLSAPVPALAQNAHSVPVAFRDSVPIGSDGLCEAQIMAPQAGQGLFDRNYTMVCQDAAAAIGELMVLGDSSAAALLADEAAAGRTCTAADRGPVPAGLTSKRRYECLGSDGLRRLLVVGDAGGKTYAATGVAVYEDAMQLGLASLATNRVQTGTVEIPLTQAGDARAFARAQAEAISAEAALTEAYRRSNSGNFAEAAEFFLASADSLEGPNAVEARLNAALQQSNLGNYLEAALLFIELQEMIGEDPILTRLARNFEAIDALNRESPGEAILLLDTPLPTGAYDLDGLREQVVTQALADRLMAEYGSAITNGTGELTTLERAQLIDAQAKYIRAAAQRSQGNFTGAKVALLEAQAELLAVRDGRIVSVLWLRAQILTELGQIAEAEGNNAAAESNFTQAVTVLEVNYPASPALVSARAEYASFLARNGRETEALVLYRALMEDADTKPTLALRKLLAPYFALLANTGDGADVAAEMFVASQLLQRPGLAQTQAVLARELSGGSDEAAQLFRQSLNIGRAIEQLRARIAQADLDAIAAGQDNAAATAEMRPQLAGLQARQLQLQQGLAQYPRYRVVSDSQMTLAELVATLQPGEAYYKLMALDDAVYAIFAQNGAPASNPASTTASIPAITARAWRLDGSPDDIGLNVDLLRDSIAIEQAGQTITYPFEIGLARELYSTMFGRIDAEVRTVEHLVFEPDGDLLRLPINLLVMDEASVTRHTARTDDPAGDPYDMRGTAWLGRAMRVSTAVSPTAFRDVRLARQSDASGTYLGLGNNLPIGAGGFANAAFANNSNTRSGGAVADRCEWSPAVWNNPILPTELITAETILAGNGQTSQLLIGANFTDTGLALMDNLDEFRILHFATHGLVTAPNPQCPPRPALLTSFGDGDSDGLLSFSEIFDLQLDADLIILSACNTASVGGLVATREAGISGTGDYALDGLVRAFVGAGGRTVVASHWPVPDDFNATQRLVAGLFEAGNGVSTTEALRRAQLALMDDADTSHPFYWAAFAVIGDGNVPVRR